MEEMESLDSCNVCMEKYDKSIRPRSLPCGHTFCTSCLGSCIEDGELECPNCKESHEAFSAESFPICYAMEGLIESLRKIKEGMVPKYQKGRAKNNFQSVFEKQKLDLLEIVKLSEEIQFHFAGYESFLLERKIVHEDLIRKISELVLRNEDILKQLSSEHEKLIDFMKEGQKYATLSREKLSSYRSVTGAKDLVEASDELEQCYLTIEEFNLRCQNQLPHFETVRQSELTVRDTNAALKMVLSATDGTASPVEVVSADEKAPKDNRDSVNEAASADAGSVESSLPLLDKLSRMRETTLTLDDLKNRSETLKILLERGHVYAVLKKDKCHWSAPVILRENKLYLHHLRNEEPPSYAHTIQQSDLIQTLKNDSVEVFMDIAWNDAIQGRVHILLTPDTPLARHFRILSTGERGASYASSSFLRVENEGDDEEEYVVGGDYELNDGGGGAPLMKDITLVDEIYQRENLPGSVWATYDANDGPKMAQFSITTGNGNGCDYEGVFGQLQNGLHIMKAAIGLDDIRNVTIAECGVVLPL